MPNHVHLLITVPACLTVERAVQFIKGGFSHRAGKELDLKAPVWQKGFSEIRVLDADAFARLQHYVHENPVAARLVSSAHDFPYSSAHPGFEIDPTPQRLKPRVLLDSFGIAEAMP